MMNILKYAINGQMEYLKFSTLFQDLIGKSNLSIR